MQATISKWGNSLALRLPRNIADQVHIKEGATVELAVEDGSITVTPSRKAFHLADLLEGEPKRLESGSPAEIDWGKPEGGEVW